MKEINELKAVATRLQEDAPEVTRAKVQKLVKICHDCLKIAG